MRGTILSVLIQDDITVFFLGKYQLFRNFCSLNPVFRDSPQSLQGQKLFGRPKSFRNYDDFSL